MTLTTAECVSAIERHSAGFAEATRGNLDASVRHCPGWTVADLVAHLTDVHWFWGTIAEKGLTEPPDEADRPARAPRERLVPAFEEGARRLVRVLGEADQTRHVWTWAPSQKDVAFITRHQVQEAAVHHWDAVHAAGGRLRIEAAVAADSVDEFLTFSVPTDAAPLEDDDTPPAPLAATFALRATDADRAWTITDGASPGTLRVDQGAVAGPPAVQATASDLLLWLYRRVEIDTASVPTDVVERFRALTFTD
jgi:uncharacterized protein (TIGR03083 family)